MSASRPLPALLVTRRTTLAAASLVALAGCEWGPSTEQVEPPEPDADAELAEEASTAIRARLEAVRATATRHPRLSTPLAALVVLHTAHLGLLDADTGAERATPSATQTPARVPARAPAALAAVRTGEQALQARLAELAGRAASGTLARAIASMSAGIAQHVAALPTAPPGRA